MASLSVKYRPTSFNDGFVGQNITAEILTDEEVIKKANLRETSLYTLAVNAGIDEPREFVKKFIEEDRRIRR